MQYLLNLGLILIASVILINAVKLFILSSSEISHHFGVSEYTISFLIVAIATSLPEIVVGISSAANGNPILSYGNALGSNIALLTIIVSIPAILNTGISTRTILHSKDVYVSIIFAITPIILTIDRVLSRPDGIILMLAYILYFILVLKRSTALEKLLIKFEKVNLLKQGIIFIFSLALLLGASEIIVKSAVNLSYQIGWGLAFIGLTVTAVGTSLPEIAFTIGATHGRHQTEILGDILGSVIANATAVLGITAIITPIEIENRTMWLSSATFLLVALLLFLEFTKTKEKVDKGEALFLIIFYLFFLAAELILQTLQ